MPTSGPGWLTAAVIAHLFSYMIGRKVQYGYLCTGEAFVFLYIPDDPIVVYLSLCVPKLDVMDNENRLHRTAVAQVFTFLLQVLRSRPPPESWRTEPASSRRDSSSSSSRKTSTRKTSTRKTSTRKTFTKKTFIRKTSTKAFTTKTSTTKPNRTLETAPPTPNHASQA